MLIKNYSERLPELVQPDNVAHYEDGVVSMLDRRVYPFRKEYVHCKTYEESAQAVRDMVTQSGGPIFVVANAMAQAAHSCRQHTSDKQRQTMALAAQILGSARPTNNNIKYQTELMLHQAQQALDCGEDVESVMLRSVEELLESNFLSSMRMGIHAAELLRDGDGILTHCWAETPIVATIMAAQDQGKRVYAYCSETRPFLQGARLTASSISQLGVPTTVINDNMPAFLMSQGKVNAFFAGSDRVTMSGHLINKVGTLQVALCCQYFHIPTYSFTHKPDHNAKTEQDVPIEMRDPEESLHCLGIRTAAADVSGYYPAFDCTPPELISGFVTDHGVFSPAKIGEYFTTSPYPA